MLVGRQVLPPIGARNNDSGLIPVQRWWGAGRRRSGDGWDGVGDPIALLPKPLVLNGLQLCLVGVKRFLEGLVHVGGAWRLHATVVVRTTGSREGLLHQRLGEGGGPRQGQLHHAPNTGQEKFLLGSCLVGAAVFAVGWSVGGEQNQGQASQVGLTTCGQQMGHG